VSARCAHAGAAYQPADCTGTAVVRLSESSGVLRTRLPLCGPCAKRYASQAVELAARCGLASLPVTITVELAEGGVR
jgi:hypothetical protein